MNMMQANPRGMVLVLKGHWYSCSSKTREKDLQDEISPHSGSRECKGLGVRVVGKGKICSIGGETRLNSTVHIATLTGRRWYLAAGLNHNSFQRKPQHPNTTPCNIPLTMSCPRHGSGLSFVPPNK